ncbi:hypothetical protein TNCV_1218631 [Trichonephila clavipes]|nr:hypothetical protein TNCV_1218631 [Trichonephila clavipes]
MIIWHVKDSLRASLARVVSAKFKSQVLFRIARALDVKITSAIGAAIKRYQLPGNFFGEFFHYPPHGFCVSQTGNRQP